MAWSTIRRATDDDMANLAKTAKRFVERHGLGTYMSPILTVADLEIGHYGESESEARHRKHLRRLWVQCVRRTLKEPAAEGIAFGYVGFEAP